MSKTRIAITSLFIAIMATLGISMAAMAATVNEGASTPIPFTHTMHANPAIDLSGITYTIDISGTAADSTTGSYVSTAVDVIGSPFAEGTITPATPSPAVRSDSSESTKIWADTETLAALFGSDDPASTDAATGYPKFASNFPQAGVYKFTISETRAGADDTKWAYTPESNGSYMLTVWIENNADDITKRHYDGWVLTDPAGDKVDVNATAGSEAGVDFTSTYTATTSLNVTKQVSGDYASTTYAFPQEITLYLPDWAGAADDITANGGATGDESGWTTSTGTTRVYKVKLAHGETVTFENLPVGTRYQIKEKTDETDGKAVDGAGLKYSPSMTWRVSYQPVSLATVATANGTYYLAKTSDTEASQAISQAEPGETVYVVAQPEENYQIASVQVNGSPLSVGNGTYSFTMPSEPTEVTVSFEGISSSLYKYDKSVSSRSEKGYLYYYAEAEGGSLIRSARYGDTVYIRANVDDGYTISPLHVSRYDAGPSHNVEISTITKDSLYSFTMPEYPVRVSATWKVKQLADYTMAELHTASEDIRTKGSGSSYYSTFLSKAGLTTTATLTDGTTVTATLVHAGIGQGLVFMLDSIGKEAHHTTSTNAGGWPASDIRASLNDDDGVLYSKLNGMTLKVGDGDKTVTPHPITTSSVDYNNGDGTQEILSANDAYWILSAKEIFGSSYGPETGSQFKYFADLGVMMNYNAAQKLKWDNGFKSAPNASGTKGEAFWLRTASAFGDSSFRIIDTNAPTSDEMGCGASGKCHILPCFCLE